MIRFPGALTPEGFLNQYWQKQPLYMAAATDGPKPALTRNELGWLATLDDVESRIVFTDRSGPTKRYQVETGPFDEAYLTRLPKRDWTLLVHDVEKHLPEFRAVFDNVAFIPDWRIDDLMVSFAAPGGGVGPHKDNYDVFLCQGTGVRNWHVSTARIERDADASRDLALLAEFEGDVHECKQGDVLYLPPGVAHWGTASRACLTYSIGMRAPQLSDLVENLPDEEALNPFYGDADLCVDEAVPGYISNLAKQRAATLADGELRPTALGRSATTTKEWVTPESLAKDDCDQALKKLARGASLRVHGMARIAWDDDYLFANGKYLEIPPQARRIVAEVCAGRCLVWPRRGSPAELEIVDWMLQNGVFEIPETS